MSMSTILLLSTFGIVLFCNLCLTVKTVNGLEKQEKEDLIR